MFGFLRRKKKKNQEKDELKDSLGRAMSKDEKDKNLKTTLDKELKKEKKRKKKPKGPNWPAFAALVLSLLVGLFFILYGRLERDGIQGLMPDFDQASESTTPQDQEVKNTPKPLNINDDGVIIFEKRGR